MEVQINENMSPVEIGDEIPILYSSDSPDKIEVNRFFKLWGKIILLMLLGTIFTILGALGFFLK